MRPRGRPRRFDPDQAVETAQQLFHAKGYDAVSVSDLTEAFGIKPPSFYAAFGSKAKLYERVLERFTRTEAIPMPDLLRQDRPVAEGLKAVIEDAAHRFAADPDASGCMVLEGIRCIDSEARSAARSYHANSDDMLYRFIAERHPDQARHLADYMSTTLAGLSSMARNGQSLDRLLASARLAGLAIEQELSG
ncbi:TetR/AcrR family transcriptional regulator [Roseibium sediminicola]|uniref:TetR/AcrR family transcriptional regulator n=1 Tax=Roseibium sediminicola TaxID=2933272 RepID=A0ABT0GYA2_9HYPH|nr:TetR/AcrR family transcriptional regulator [Roseibium sp. CAU 1639]MCK7613798.1 TetR/AcrR family transcriptional regulator [Roseibium sp. CAU 1639]